MRVWRVIKTGNFTLTTKPLRFWYYGLHCCLIITRSKPVGRICSRSTRFGERVSPWVVLLLRLWPRLVQLICRWTAVEWISFWDVSYSCNTWQSWAQVYKAIYSNGCNRLIKNFRVVLPKIWETTLCGEHARCTPKAGCTSTKAYLVHWAPPEIFWCTSTPGGLARSVVYRSPSSIIRNC